ncbi:MAG TPA: 23S rRNA pseudouridine(1911/1915/1917) synthase RluD [Gammaproteobacteria bacterium]|nr:23S rRNA pseudouridine(1911/1915/1917) synthase RluD [Gammaproteobacteria bacterium]
MNKNIVVIPEEHAGERLDQTLAKLMPLYSRTQIKEWIDAGHVLVDGSSIKGKTKLKGGEVVEVTIEERPALEDVAQPLPLHIIYEDDAFLVVNKPIGLVVHPGAGNADRTLLNALLYHAPSLKHLPRAGILHRLDKDTSGLLLVAKTAAAFKKLSSQLKNRTLVREYQAIISGVLISGGSVDAPIARHPLQRKRMAVIETGKPSVTHYRVMDRYRAHTRLKLQLETGRTHQIRVHMAHIRHPIIGDATYGGRLQLAKGTSDALKIALRQIKRQALHAFALELVHPTTEQPMRFECELPEDMQTLISILKRDNNE